MLLKVIWDSCLGVFLLQHEDINSSSPTCVQVGGLLVVHLRWMGVTCFVFRKRSWDHPSKVVLPGMMGLSAQMFARFSVCSNRLQVQCKMYTHMHAGVEFWPLGFWPFSLNKTSHWWMAYLQKLCFLSRSATTPMKVSPPSQSGGCHPQHAIPVRSGQGCSGSNFCFLGL